MSPDFGRAWIKTINDMITKNDISRFEDTILVHVNNKQVYFHIWGYNDKTDVEGIETQLLTALNLGMKFEEVEKHMELNGYEVSLEDIDEDVDDRLFDNNIIIDSIEKDGVIGYYVSYKCESLYFSTDREKALKVANTYKVGNNADGIKINEA